MPAHRDPKDEQKDADQGEQGNQVVHINEKAMPDEKQTVSD